MRAAARAGPATRLDFADLDGWPGDDHAAALAAFRLTGEPGCEIADARRFFETRFRPVRVGEGGPALVTGYYEPELEASLVPGPRFRHPIYRLPPGGCRAGRAGIEGGDLLRGHELAWLEDAVEAFFLQVQGSGRLRLDGGGTMRVGFAGRNGHPYRSIGREMLRRGLLAAPVTAEAIKGWLRAHPAEAPALLAHNPSFVFFRDLPHLPDTAGPLGTAGVPLTPLRSLAVDPAVVPLGTPVWLETRGLRRLMVAQDTGAAIRGAQRADVFCGTGAAAGRRAGGMADPGRLVLLLPASGPADS